MASRPQPPGKAVDVDFLVFVERNATDLLTMDILTFFGSVPDFVGTTEGVAQQLGRSSQSIRAELGELVLKGVLAKNQLPNGEWSYQLVETENIRRMTLKLANSQATRQQQSVHQEHTNLWLSRVQY